MYMYVLVFAQKFSACFSVLNVVDVEIVVIIAVAAAAAAAAAVVVVVAVDESLLQSSNSI